VSKPYVIGVSSQKGGVGKTTVSVNLAIALRSFNYKVLLIDGDVTNPSIGFHMGLDHAKVGYRDLLYDKAELNDVVMVHKSSGLHVIPGTLNTKKFAPTKGNISKLGNKLSKSKYDFIIFDTAPGFVEEDLSAYYNEALILTTPEMTACASSLRLAHEYDKVKVKHNLVVNRVKNKSYEISIKEIEEISKGKVVGSIPEDEIVPVSVSEHRPAYTVGPNSNFSRSVNKIARKYGSGSDKTQSNASKQENGFVMFLKRLFGFN
jgi:septum site-determining protein MinD